LLAAALCLVLLAALSWHSASRTLHAARLAERHHTLSAALDGMTMSILRAEAAHARYLSGGHPPDRARRDHALAAFGAATRALDPAVLEQTGHAARFKLLQQHAIRRQHEWAAPPAFAPGLQRAAATLPDKLEAVAQDRAAREAQLLGRLRDEGRLWQRYANPGFAMPVGLLAVALYLVFAATTMRCRVSAAHARREEHQPQRSAQLEQANFPLASGNLARADLIEEERKRISRDMHDGLGQELFALKLALARLHADSADSRLHTNTGQMLRLVDDLMGNLRAIIDDLRPAALERGLDAAVRSQADAFRRRAGKHCRLDLHLEPVALDQQTATAVFRMLQEALANILRHAGATHVRVELAQSGDTLLLSVTDNGCGFRPAAGDKAGSFGLIGMRERAGAFGGRLDIDSAPGRGTALALAIPLTRPR
jgi:signal transduction histidine kinase